MNSTQLLSVWANKPSWKAKRSHEILRGDPSLAEEPAKNRPDDPPVEVLEEVLEPPQPPAEKEELAPEPLSKSKFKRLKALEEKGEKVEE